MKFPKISLDFIEVFQIFKENITIRAFYAFTK